MSVIQFHNVSKAYKLGSAHSSLREVIPNLAKRLTGRNGAASGETLWALKDVSFEVERGQTVALIGANGAGKTTILKLLSKVTRPTSGDIKVDGRISALIELGAGFHMDLTGRENVFLSGSIMGLSQKEIEAKFDSIVAFAGLERFIDTPVKRYSSGMYVRLGFAVAIHVEPEVLLVDEVLAVGDMAFQRRCLDKISEIRSKGATVLFVSHNMRTVESLCTQGIWMEKGQVRQIGPLPPIIAGYTDEMNRAINAGNVSQYGGSERRGSGEVQFTTLRLRNGSKGETNQFRLGDKLVLEMGYRAHQRVRKPSFDVAVYADNGTRVCTATTRLSGCTPEYLEGEGVVRCVFDSIPFMPGGYSATVAIFDEDDLGMYDQWYRAVAFTVDSELMGDVQWHLQQEEHGVVYLPPQWEL